MVNYLNSTDALKFAQYCAKLSISNPTKKDFDNWKSLEEDKIIIGFKVSKSDYDVELEASEIVSGQLWDNNLFVGKIKLYGLDSNPFAVGSEYRVELTKIKRSPDEKQIKITTSVTDGITYAHLQGVYSFHGKHFGKVVVSESQKEKIKFPFDSKVWINIPENSDIQEVWNEFIKTIK